MIRSNYPGGFGAGITIRDVPIVQSHPGKVFWVYNGTDLLPGQRGGSDGNKGTFDAPFATLMGAIAKTAPNRGDIIFIKPGHAENVSSATLFNLNVAGVAIIGLGTGSNRPTFTYDTANTSTITVSAANVTLQNCRFKANFLGLAAAITLTTAAEFSCEKNQFFDTSATLNFLTIIKSTGAANTADGLTFNDNFVTNQGTTSNNTTILTANDISRFTAQRNYMKWAVNNDKAILCIVTSGFLTSAIITDNMAYRLNTSTAGGSLVNVGGTSSSGIVARNYVQTATTTSDLLFSTTSGLAAFENRVSGVVGATGFVIPAVDS